MRGERTSSSSSTIQTRFRWQLQWQCQFQHARHQLQPSNPPYATLSDPLRTKSVIGPTGVIHLLGLKKVNALAFLHRKCQRNRPVYPSVHHLHANDDCNKPGCEDQEEDHSNSIARVHGRLVYLYCCLWEECRVGNTKCLFCNVQGCNWRKKFWSRRVSFKLKEAGHVLVVPFGVWI